jgi:hypothetical protein
MARAEFPSPARALKHLAVEIDNTKQKLMQEALSRCQIAHVEPQSSSPRNREKSS